MKRGTTIISIIVHFLPTFRVDHFGANAGVVS